MANSIELLNVPVSRSSLFRAGDSPSTRHRRMNQSSLAYMFQEPRESPTTRSIRMENKYRCLGVAESDRVVRLPPIAGRQRVCHSEMDIRSPIEREMGIKAKQDAEYARRTRAAAERTTYNPLKDALEGDIADTRARHRARAEWDAKVQSKSYLPPSLAQAEGRKYNLANPPPPAATTTYSNSRKKALPNQGAHRQCKSDRDIQTTNNSLARAAPARWLSEFRRGYDILTSRSLTMSQPIPRARPRVEGYDKLVRESRTEKKLFAFDSSPTM